MSCTPSVRSRALTRTTLLRWCAWNRWAVRVPQKWREVGAVGRSGHHLWPGMLCCFACVLHRPEVHFRSACAAVEGTRQTCLHAQCKLIHPGLLLLLWADRAARNKQYACNPCAPSAPLLHMRIRAAVAFWVWLQLSPFAYDCSCRPSPLTWSCVSCAATPTRRLCGARRSPWTWVPSSTPPPASSPPWCECAGCGLRLGRLRVWGRGCAEGVGRPYARRPVVGSAAGAHTLPRGHRLRRHCSMLCQDGVWSACCPCDPANSHACVHAGLRAASYLWVAALSTWVAPPAHLQPPATPMCMPKSRRRCWGRPSLCRLLSPRFLCASTATCVRAAAGWPSQPALPGDVGRQVRPRPDVFPCRGPSGQHTLMLKNVQPSVLWY